MGSLRPKRSSDASGIKPCNPLFRHEEARHHPALEDGLLDWRGITSGRARIGQSEILICQHYAGGCNASDTIYQCLANCDPQVLRGFTGDCGRPYSLGFLARAGIRKLRPSGQQETVMYFVGNDVEMAQACIHVARAKPWFIPPGRRWLRL